MTITASKPATLAPTLGLESLRYEALGTVGDERKAVNEAYSNLLEQVATGWQTVLATALKHGEILSPTQITAGDYPEGVRFDASVSVGVGKKDSRRFVFVRVKDENDEIGLLGFCDRYTDNNHLIAWQECAGDGQFSRIWSGGRFDHPSLFESLATLIRHGNATFVHVTNYADASKNRQVSVSLKLA